MSAALIDTRHEYAHVFWIYVPIAIGVFVLVSAAVVAAVLRYRGRRPEEAARWSENNKLEAGYAFILLLVVAFLLFVSFSAEHADDTVSSHQRPWLTVDVTGSRWEWNFSYRGYRLAVHSGTFGHQPLVVPTGRTVRFNLTTTDVIHSFWIPELRFKRDLMPGTAERVTLDFSRPGHFSGACAEFCGYGHAQMVFSVDAVSPQRFLSWAQHGGRSTP